MEANLRNFVRNRAAHCCEYCGLSESAIPFLTFPVDHIRSRQHGGSDDPSNLALACGHCNARKGPNLTGIDPETDQIVPLFNPRGDSRSEHFAIHGITIVGLTPVDRATVYVLAMNSQLQLDARSDLEWDLGAG
jgi:hypothetical protein